MSVENLKEYTKLCLENEEARKKAKEIGLQDMNGHIAHAKTLGLEISKEDFEALAKEAGFGEKKELSEADLQKVAGGAASVLPEDFMAASLAAGMAALQAALAAALVAMAPKPR